MTWFLFRFLVVFHQITVTVVGVDATQVKCSREVTIVADKALADVENQVRHYFLSVIAPVSPFNYKIVKSTLRQK